jgi:predicted nucleotidyltransferase
LSGLRLLGPGFDPGIVAALDARLRSVAEDEHAVVLLAVESGSRAWGFPSPDSDYDCRFIYARARDDYLRLYPPRDVIEFPLDRILDVNGWDLAKALRLLLKGNAVVIEWLTSPFVYAGSESFRAQSLAFAPSGAAGGDCAALSPSRRAPAPNLFRRYARDRAQEAVLRAAARARAALAAAACRRGGRAHAFSDPGDAERPARADRCVRG